jgi:hypothetical protein
MPEVQATGLGLDFRRIQRKLRIALTQAETVAGCRPAVLGQSGYGGKIVIDSAAILH